MWRPQASSVLIWTVLVATGLLVGAAVAVLPTPFVAALVVLGVVMLVFLWFSGDPLIPFLLVVASIQAGMLLRLPLGDAPIQSVAPFFGAWAIAALVAKGLPPRAQRRPSTLIGRLLPAALAVLAVLVVVTAFAQVWRPRSEMLDLTEALTLVQLAFLLILASLLMTTPERVLWLGYVAAGSGAVMGLLSVAGRFGLLGLTMVEMTAEGVPRVTGFAGDPNRFAFYLLVSMAFAVNLALAAKSNRSRIILWSTTAVIGGGIVSTYSAGAVIGVLAIVVISVILQWRVSVKRGLVALSLVATVAIVVALLVPPGYADVVGEKYAGLVEGPFAAAGTGRGAAWEAALVTVADNPLLGSGLSTRATQVAIAANYTAETVVRKAAHNTYLALGVAAGVAGLAAFLVVCFAAAALLWSVHTRALARGEPKAVSATACLLTALLTTLVVGLQLDLQTEKYLWLLLGAALGVGFWNLDRSESGVSSGAGGPGR